MLYGRRKQKNRPSGNRMGDREQVFLVGPFRAGCGWKKVE